MLLQDRKRNLRVPLALYALGRDNCRTLGSRLRYLETHFEASMDVSRGRRKHCAVNAGEYNFIRRESAARKRYRLPGVRSGRTKVHRRDRASNHSQR
jgi:hypothetical protein